MQAVDLVLEELDEVQGRLMGWQEDLHNVVNNLTNMTFSDCTSMSDIRDELEEILVTARQIHREGIRLENIMKEVVKS